MRTPRMANAFISRHKTLLAATTALAGLCAMPAHAEDGVLPGDTVFVTATMLPAEAYTIGSAISVLDEAYIEQRQNPVVSDLLRSVPSISVSRSGGAGQLTQVRMRGAEGNHTLVLIDGVEANELNFNGEFDYAGLLAIGIERIEVLRGAQSALYGSDAMGGVINIITKSGHPGFRFEGSAEGGSFAQRQVTALVSGGTDRVNGALSAGYFGTNGINLSRLGSEKDGSRTFTISGKGMAQLTDTFHVDATARYVSSKNDTDAQDFDFPPTPTNGLIIDTLDQQQKNDQFYGRVQGELSLFDDHWVHQASAQYADTQREYIDVDDDLTGNHGSRLKLAYQNTLTFDTPSFLDAKHYVTTAYQHEQQRFVNRGAVPDALENQTRKEPQDSFIGEYRVELADQVYLSGGIRYDDNRQFANATTYRVAAAWRLKEMGTRFHASHGTAITAPGFFELYGFFPDFFIGNPDLQPEESKSFDIGVEQKFFDDKLTVDVTYFHADLQNEIVTVFDFDTFLSTAENLDGKSKRNGLEVMMTANVTDALSLAGSYTYTNSREPDGDREVRRPKHMANFNVNYAFGGGRGNLNLDVSYNGKQLDNEFIDATPESVVTLKDYVLVTLAASYQLTESLQVYGRVENLIDQDYEEVFSYRSPGIGAFAGLKVKLGD